jgi:membrane protease YdiL (CAAX protease family)
MNALELDKCVLVAIPIMLIPSTAFVFASLTKRLGKEKGYLLGFLVYWTIWCLFVPLLLIGTKDFSSLFAEAPPLLSRPNWLVALLWVFITLVTFLLYGRDFLRAPLILILIAIPAASINGICEEILWRGLYVKTFPENMWLAILFPSVGFALWHLVPLSVFSEGNKWMFVLSTFFLGLAYGFIAYRTGSAKWTAISHSINGILALGGMLAPSVLKLLAR